MKCSEYLAGYPARMEDLVKRAKDAISGHSEAQLNQRPDPKTWSCAEIFDHLLVSNDSYIESMRQAISNGAKGDPEVSYSFMGRMIIKAAGPEGNAPVPSAMVPRASTFPSTVVDDWSAQMSKLSALAEAANGADLVAARFPNPFAKFMRLRVTDAFEIIAQHGERHVRQIEHRSTLVR